MSLRFEIKLSLFHIMAAITHRPIGRTTTKKLAVSAVIILGSIYIIINVLLITNREYGVVEQPLKMQFYSDTSAISFCGDDFWSNTQIRCNERVQFLHETFAMTVDEAISSLLKEGECICNQTGATKHSIHKLGLGFDPLPHATPETAGSYDILLRLKKIDQHRSLFRLAFSSRIAIFSSPNGSHTIIRLFRCVV